jgi:hypothetical protein
VQSNCAGQNSTLDVSANRYQLIRAVVVANTHNILFDDRSFIEIGRHIVCGRANELHATVVGLVIRLGAFESGQKRVVNVDDLASV